MMLARGVDVHKILGLAQIFVENKKIEINNNRFFICNFNNNYSQKLHRFSVIVNYLEKIGELVYYSGDNF